MRSTLTPAIDVINVTENKGIFTVQYWDEAHEGENNVEMQISEEALLNFIEEDGRNVETFTNWKFVTLECDGYDERTIDPASYLAEYQNEVIKDYITANSLT